MKFEEYQALDADAKMIARFNSLRNVALANDYELVTKEERPKPAVAKARRVVSKIKPTSFSTVNWSRTTKVAGRVTTVQDGVVTVVIHPTINDFNVVKAKKRTAASFDFLPLREAEALKVGDPVVVVRPENDESKTQES